MKSLWPACTRAIAVSVLALPACGKGASGATTNTTSTPAQATPRPAASAPPGPTPSTSSAPAAMTPGPRPPFEALSFKASTRKGSNNWPRFEAENLGTRTVTSATLFGYAYNKNGKVVARTTVGYSWSTTLAAGAKADADIDVGARAKAPPADAVTFEICYNRIKFDGDVRSVEDSKRCGEKRPMNGS